MLRDVKFLYSALFTVYLFTTSPTIYTEKELEVKNTSNVITSYLIVNNVIVPIIREKR